MTNIIELDQNYSTTGRVVKGDPLQMAEVAKLFNKPDGKFETVLFLPEGEGWQGEGGLRTKGYFKFSEENLIKNNECLILNGKAFEDSDADNSKLKNNNLKLHNKPLITIVTVVFNGEKFLEETILSVINQTYDNVEYIIIDGGSTDGTLEIIRKYEHAIDYWVSEKDKGIYDAMNKGIDLATGDWINFMNGGDGFCALSVMSEVFMSQTDQDAKILYGNHQVIYPSGRTRVAKAGLVKNLWKGSQFCHQASFVKKDYHKANKFNLCTKIVADFEFFYKAWQDNTQFKFVDVVVAKFESGGVSDIKRIDSILGHWFFVDKSLKNNVFYCFLIIKESLKAQMKRFF